jgi:hypothetical protein
MNVSKFNASKPWQERNQWHMLVGEEGGTTSFTVHEESQEAVERKAAWIVLALESYNGAHQMIQSLMGLKQNQQNLIFDTLLDAETNHNEPTPPGIIKAEVGHQSINKSVVQEAINRAIQNAKEKMDSDVDN